MLLVTVRGDGRRYVGTTTDARTAGAQRLASGPFAAAANAEREAQRLLYAGRLGEATVKFYEASGLYRSAEVTAQNETTRREAASRAESLGPDRSGTSALPAPPATSQQA